MWVMSTEIFWFVLICELRKLWWKIGKYGSKSGMVGSGGGKEPRCSCNVMGANGGDVSRS